jgi:hypothetical protein
MGNLLCPYGVPFFDRIAHQRMAEAKAPGRELLDRSGTQRGKQSVDDHGRQPFREARHLRRGKVASEHGALREKRADWGGQRPHALRHDLQDRFGQRALDAASRSHRARAFDDEERIAACSRHPSLDRAGWQRTARDAPGERGDVGLAQGRKLDGRGVPD